MRYAIAIEMDKSTLKLQYTKVKPQNDPESYTNLYTDINKFFKNRGFTIEQRTLYFSDNATSYNQCVEHVKEFSANNPWFKPSIRRISILEVPKRTDILEII
ncbi:hypothetical protein [Azospirillum sp. TSH58]|uniref:hypothetical protein n=1 Tax=Azospirillum sp. TSH58 TaxID=664962 RepID=UPI0011B23B23|nr:hypothetical protein [Azospirillum sp. TSH58]